MGEVLLSPLIAPVPRRVLAGVTAVLANLLFLALIIALPRQHISAPQRAPFEITLAPAPEDRLQQTEEDVLEEVDAPLEAEIDQASAPVTVTARDSLAVSALPLPPAGETDDEDETSPVTGLAAFTGPIALPNTTSATQSVLHNVFCSTTSDVNREGLPCPDQTGPASGVFARNYSDEELEALQAAFGLNLSADQIRALFSDGPPVRDLAGQPTLTSQHSQQTSSADSMRDSLPPLHPDPAFGD